MKSLKGPFGEGPRSDRRLSLVFTGHEFAEGGTTILNELARRKARGSFFLTGDFLAKPEFEPMIRRIVAEGHYLGPHSDRHLLYCDWTAEKRRLVSRETFEVDLLANLKKVARFTSKHSNYFLPPYEHHDQEIARWTREMGLTLVNFTRGTRSNADYTEDEDKSFVSSQAIFESITRQEQRDRDGLNGFLLLLHIGAGPRRTDKFHNHFGKLLDDLTARGYALVRVDELLDAE